MDREAIDPPLAAVMGPEGGPDETRSFECSEVSIPRGSELGGDRGSALPTLRPRVHAAQPEQADHCVVIRQSQSTEANRYGHYSSILLSSVASATMTVVSYGSWC